MMETLRMLLVLTAVSAASALGLAAFNEHAQPIIKDTERKVMINRQLKKVVSDREDPDPCRESEAGFDNDPSMSAVCVDGREVYPCKRGGELVGYAFTAVGRGAYSGTLTCLVGMRPDGVLTGLEIVKHEETPGLGTEIENCEWRRQFVGRGPDDIKWKVRSDGGDIDAVSGATISSRAVVDCVTNAQAFLRDNAGQIASAAPMASNEACNDK